MALLEIIAYITDALKTIPGIGEVYDHYNYSRSRKGLMDGFEGAKINAWFVSRYRTQEEYAAPNIHNTVHTIYIYGYYIIKEKDDTATAFQNLVEKVRARFFDDYNLGGNCHYCPPVMLKYVDEATLLHFPCHTCLLILSPVIRNVL